MDHWRDIFELLWRRKLRTGLTALSVSWGIFMLVVLLGGGEGLSSGAESEFAKDAMNSVSFSAGRRSKPYGGQPVDTTVRLTNDDYDLTREGIDVVDRITA